MDEDDSFKNLVTLGTPFRGINYDREPSKKVLSSIQTQGRRRLHGAFTGGFTAGYFNTVGSEEGFMPRQFVSSRSQKAPSKELLPRDFMDDEDINNMTSAGKDLSVLEIYNSGQKAKSADKLYDLIKPSPNSSCMGHQLLLKIGWREGRGIGPRRIRSKTFQKSSQYFQYVPKSLQSDQKGHLISRSPSIGPKLVETGPDSSHYSSTFSESSPIVKLERFRNKEDYFGLGYNPKKGENTGIMMCRSRFGSLGFKNREENAKCRKMALGEKSDTTSAFGISVLEDFDPAEDIYRSEQKSNYDTEICVVDNPQNNDSEFKNQSGLFQGSQSFNGLKNRKNAFSDKASSLSRNVSKMRDDQLGLKGVFSRSKSSFLKCLSGFKKASGMKKSLEKTKNPVKSIERSERVFLLLKYTLKVPRWFDGRHRFDLPGMKISPELLKLGLKIPHKSLEALKRYRNLNSERRREILGEKPLETQPVSMSLRKNFTVGKVLVGRSTKKLKKGLSFVEEIKDPFDKLKVSYGSMGVKAMRFHLFLNETLLFDAVKLDKYNQGVRDITDQERIDFKKKFEEFEKENPRHPVLVKMKKITEERKVKSMKIFRTVDDWMPERLLCKRFKVPEPSFFKNAKELEVAKKLIEKSRPSNAVLKVKPDKKIESNKNNSDDEKDTNLDQTKPSVALFKAIFEDSDSEDFSEESVDAVLLDDSERCETVKGNPGSKNSPILIEPDERREDSTTEVREIDYIDKNYNLLETKNNNTETIVLYSSKETSKSTKKRKTMYPEKPPDEVIEINRKALQRQKRRRKEKRKRRQEEIYEENRLERRFERFKRGTRRRYHK